jgi:hypothetical protein
VGPQSETNIDEPSCDTREIPSVPSPTSCAQSSSWEYPGRWPHGCNCHLVKLHGRFGWRPGHPFHDGNPNIHDVYIHINRYEFMTVLRRISALHPSFHHGTMVDLLESKNVGKVGENHVDMSPRSSMLHAVPYIAGCFEFKCTWMRLNISCMHETSCIRTPQSGPICHPLILVS